MSGMSHRSFKRKFEMVSTYELIRPSSTKAMYLRMCRRALVLIAYLTLLYHFFTQLTESRARFVGCEESVIAPDHGVGAVVPQRVVHFLHVVEGQVVSV